MARILLIEADRVLATNLQAFLKAAGHQVEWHVDPQVAMDAIDKKKPDLLILDLLLAGRSGVEFLYELRSYPDWQKLPIIVFSSVSNRELGQSAPDALKQLDIAAYLYKPETNLSQLAAAVKQALQPASVR